MVAQKTNKWKWIILAAVGVALFFLGWQCHSRKVDKSAGTVKTVTKDSLVYVSVPVPYKVDNFIKGKDGRVITVTNHDTLEIYETVIQPTDTAEVLKKLLKRFNDVAYYEDFRDSGRAKVLILDTVTQNRIKGRSVKVVCVDTNTVTTIVKTQPRNIVLSFTGSLLGNFRNPIYGQGGGLQLKLPNDASYQFQIFVIDKHRPMMQFTKTIPIHLKSKK